MSIQVQECFNVAERLQELDCVVPVGIAILPRNLTEATSREELYFDGTASTIRKLLKEANINLDSIEKENDSAQFFVQKSLEWIGPVILLTTTAYTENPHIVSLTLGVITNYVTDFFKGIAGPSKVRLRIIAEKKKGKEYVQIDYEGSPDGLSELPEIIAKARDDG